VKLTAQIERIEVNVEPPMTLQDYAWEGVKWAGWAILAAEVIGEL
jgi:hypothetical protein